MSESPQTSAAEVVTQLEDISRVTFLQQSLWRRLTAADTARDMSAAWAALMFDTLDAAEHCAVFLLDPTTGRLLSTAGSPDTRLPGDGLLAAVEDAQASGKGNVRGALEDGTATQGRLVAIAAPLTIDGKTLGAVGAELSPRSQTDLRLAMRQLQWGAAWLRDALRRERALVEASRYDSAVHALYSVVGVAEQPSFATASRAAATDLATRFACDRVSIGFRKTWRTRVVAISHSAQFSKRMSLVRQLGAAMDEAIDQRGIVIYPPEAAEEPIVAHRHEMVARAHAIDNMVTVPLFAVDRFVGAVTFERSKDSPFTQSEVEILEAVVTVIAPVLDEKRRNDRWLITKTASAIYGQFVRLVGPGKLMRKLVVLTAVALTAFFWFAPGEIRVSADATIEGRIQRNMTAPLDGFIAESFVRAGDRVDAGTVLVRFDERDLALERLRLVTVLQRQEIEFDKALASGDRSETPIQRSLVAQTQAQIELVDRQLGRMSLTAPFDGLIVAGDLSQEIGAAVTQGEPLLTIAPVDDYRVTLRVDERRIAEINVGQAGQLLVTALPNEPFPITVTKITPLAEYGDGATTFRVEAELNEGADRLQPGMEGVGKILIGDALLISIWTRPLFDWSRITLWRWVGWK